MSSSLRDSGDFCGLGQMRCLTCLHPSVTGFCLAGGPFHERCISELTVVNPFRLSVIAAREAQWGPFGIYFQMVRIFILALLAFALCSCADSYDILGLHLKPAANGDYDNAGHVPGSGDPS